MELRSLKVKGRPSIKKSSAKKVLIEQEPDILENDGNDSRHSFSENDESISDDLNCSRDDRSTHSEVEVVEPPKPISSKPPEREEVSPPPTTDNSVYGLFGIVLLFALALFYLTGDGSTKHSTNPTDQCDIERALNEANADILLHLKVGIKDVEQFEKPSVFLYLYESAPEEYVNDFVRNLSVYASCTLNEIYDDPIELTNMELNSSLVKSDFGRIIERYEHELKNRKVMVVKHLEQIPGIVAQVFHSFCDGVTPLVAKSVFMFTMKVDDLRDSRSDYKTVEGVLRRKWSELDEDVFEPLLTRISNMILRIKE